MSQVCTCPDVVAAGNGKVRVIHADKACPVHAGTRRRTEPAGTPGDLLGLLVELDRAAAKHDAQTDLRRLSYHEDGPAEWTLDVTVINRTVPYRDGVGMNEATIVDPFGADVCEVVSRTIRMFTVGETAS